MGLIILQRKQHATGKLQAVPKNEVRLSLTLPTQHANCKAKATLRVTFGENVQHAKYYCIGVDDGRLVLVPCEDQFSGYVVSSKSHQNNLLRIDLTDTSLSMFSRGILDELKERRIYQLSGRVDNNGYVWIEGNN